MNLARGLVALGLLLVCAGVWIVAGLGWSVLIAGVFLAGYGLALVDVGEIDHTERTPG